MSRIEDLLDDHSREALLAIYGDDDTDMYEDLIGLANHALNQRRRLAALEASIRGQKKRNAELLDPDHLPQLVAEVERNRRSTVYAKRVTEIWKEYFRREYRELAAAVTTGAFELAREIAARPVPRACRDCGCPREMHHSECERVGRGAPVYKRHGADGGG